MNVILINAMIMKFLSYFLGTVDKERQNGENGLQEEPNTCQAHGSTITNHSAGHDGAGHPRATLLCSLILFR